MLTKQKANWIMPPYLTPCSGFPVLSGQNPVYNAIWKAFLIWLCWSQCNSWHVQLLVGPQISSISSNSWLHSNQEQYSASWNIPLAHPIHVHMHTYLPDTCFRLLPRHPLICTSYVLLPSISLPTVTARLPSYVSRCTQNFPQLSTYTSSPKWLFTSLKPLTSTAIPPWTRPISSEAPHHPVRY